MKSYFLSFFICFISLSSLAEEVLFSTQTVTRFSLSPNLAYTQLSISDNNTSLSGPGVEVLLQYAIQEKSAIGFSYRQMSLGSESSGSALNFRYIYALTGSLMKKSSSVKLNSKTVLNNSEVEIPAWCIQAIGSQYYINTSVNAVPFTGFGLGTYYKYPIRGFSSFFGGVNYESMQNNATLTSLSLFFGMDFKI